MGCCGSVEAKGEVLVETCGDHEGAINCMDISEDGTMLVTGSDDSTAIMWSLDEHGGAENLGRLQGHASYINAVAIVERPNAPCVVLTGSADSTIRKWDVTKCECLFVYEGHTARVQKLFVTGDLIVSSSYDSTAKVWLLETDDIPAGEEANALVRDFTGHGKGIYPMIFVPGESRVHDHDEEGATGDGWDADGDGSLDDVLLTGSSDCTARAWNFETAKCLKIFKGHKGAVTTMAVDSKGSLLYTASADSTIKSWSVATGKIIRTYSGHEGSILCMHISNRLMYSGGEDAFAKCWVRDTGDCTRTYRGHKHAVVCMNLELGTLFTGCADGGVRAYNATTGTLKQLFVGHEGAVNCLAVKGNRVYSGASDSYLRIWDTKELWDDVLFDDDEPAPEQPNVIVADGEMEGQEDQEKDGEEDQDVQDADEGQPEENEEGNEANEEEEHEDNGEEEEGEGEEEKEEGGEEETPEAADEGEDKKEEEDDDIEHVDA